jgi:hypothetical protein
MKRVTIWNPLMRERLIEDRAKKIHMPAHWIDWGKPSPRARNVSLRTVNRFDARNMDKVYSRGDDYDKHRRFDLEAWFSRDGSLFARFWSHSKKVKDLSIEVTGFKPDQSLFGVVPESDPAWLPKSLRDAYEEWTVREMF